MIGAVSGFAVGMTIGLASGDDPAVNTFPIYYPEVTAKQKGMVYGLIGALGGGALGAMFGSSKFTIAIDGDLEKYKLNKNQIMEYSIVKDN